MNRNEMINAYNANTAADSYNLGFVYQHTLYGIDLVELPDECLKEDRSSASRGGKRKIRIRVSKALKVALIAAGAVVLGSEAMLNTNDKYNKGERYERIITERAGQVWVKDSVPFNVAGDIELNGKQVQIKLDGATLVEEATLMKLMAA